MKGDLETDVFARGVSPRAVGDNSVKSGRDVSFIELIRLDDRTPEARSNSARGDRLGVDFNGELFFEGDGLVTGIRELFFYKKNY